MDENQKVRIAITHGDTNATGYELILKTFEEPTMLELCTPIVYGSPKVAAYHRKSLEMQQQLNIIANAEEARDGRLNLLTTFDDEIKVSLGEPTPESGMAGLKALDRAMTDFRQHSFDALVTLPISNSNVSTPDFTFPGQTAYIEASLDEAHQSMPIRINEHLRLALLTEGLPLKDVPQAITAENLKQKLTLFYNTLRRDFRLTAPRIAVLSLNPLRDGDFGDEERNVIEPTVDELREQGILTFGPYAADEFFAQGQYDSFDGILAMYDDQGLVPYKAMTQEWSIVYLAGLSVVCTRPDMEVDFANAGENVSDPIQLRQAIYAAIDCARNRVAFDEAHADPLRKLYREKRDDSEKVRFSIPKKHENKAPQE